MKEQMKAPEKKTTKWWRDSQPIKCTVQNTVNQDAHRNGWVWLQNKGKSEGYAKWNKGKIYREPTVKGRKPGLKSMVWSRRKKWTFNQNRMKTRIQNNEERLRNLWDNFKHSNLNHRGARRRRGRARSWKLTWKNNGELSQSGKGKRFLPESPGSPKEVGPMMCTP